MNQSVIALAAVNILAFALFGIDKAKAKAGQWRISERVLLGTAICFGAFGAWIGMKVFHHKTRKPLFAMGVPLLCLLQAGLLVYSLYRK